MQGETVSPPSLVLVRATQGLVWKLAVGLITSFVALVGTLLSTRWVTPETFHEINSAALVAAGLQLLALPHLPRYLVVARKDGSIGWHVTMLVAITAVMAAGAALFLGGPIGAWLELPSLPTLLPWYAALIVFSRLAAVPEWLLARRLRFRDLSLVRGGSVIVRNLLVVALLGFLNFGAMAIIAGVICQAVIHFVGMVALARRKEWLKPAPLSLAKIWKILRFALPLGGANLMEECAGYGATQMIGRYVGPAHLGIYNSGRQIGLLSNVDAHLDEVVFSALAEEKIKHGSAHLHTALLRVLGLIALVCFPIAAWLAAAAPAIVAALFTEQWRDVAWVMLAFAGVAPLRFIGSTIGYYLQADRRTVAVLMLSLLQAAIIIGGLVVAGQTVGLDFVAIGVVMALAYGGHALASMILMTRRQAISMEALIHRVLPPVGACVVLVLVVAVARITLLELWVGSPLVLLVLLVVGLGAYVVAARRLARGHTDELITLLKLALRRRPLEGKDDDKIAAIFD